MTREVMARPQPMQAGAKMNRSFFHPQGILGKSEHPMVPISQVSSTEERGEDNRQIITSSIFIRY